MTNQQLIGHIPDKKNIKIHIVFLAYWVENILCEQR